MIKTHLKIAKRLAALLISSSLIISSFAVVAAEEQNGNAAGEAIQSYNTDIQAASDQQQSLSDDEMYLERMQKICENDTLALYFDNDVNSITSTSIAVKDKRSGKIWFSNPPDPSSDKKVSGEANKAKLSSQLYITYYNANDQKKNLDNSRESIKKQQFTVKQIKNGIRVEYLIGSKERNKEDLPTKISDKRMKEVFLSKLSEDEQKIITGKLYTYRQADDCWEWNSTNKTAEEKIMLGFIDKVGYTRQDLEYDNVENGVSVASSDKIWYFIPVEYTLENDNLVVRIPLSEVQYPEKYPLNQLDVLEFFGAADITKDGYIFVPDGSGALINFKNGSKASNAYMVRLYGDDKGVEILEKKTYFEQSVMPVFGLKQGNNAFFAIIEDGDALAAINAYKAGGYNSYNAVYPSFFVVAKDTTKLGDGNYNTNITSFQKDIYKGDLKIRYAFLNGNDANYAGMAEYYRNYLIGKYGIQKLTPKENMPLYIETMGAVRKIKSFLGISYRGLEPLTKYSEAKQILTELKAQGIDNIKLRYSGWFNNGMDQTVAKSVDLERVLGGKEQFKDLVSYVNENGIDFYPDVSFQFNPRGYGLNLYKDVAKFIDQRFARSHIFDNVSQRSTGFNYNTSPNALPRIIDSFLKDYEKYNIKGISLNDMGSDIFSDFTKGKSVDRQTSAKIIQEQIGKLQEHLKNVMITEGNQNAILKSDCVISAPMESSKFNVEDEDVPFFEMVYHGFVEYAGQPLNLSSNYMKDYLKAVELGAGLYYQWTYAPSSKLKDTRYDYVYSSNYKIWMDKAVQSYKAANDVLKYLQDKEIIDHVALGKDVYETVYEDGTSVIVNYNEKPVEVKGVKVDAENFKVIKGGK